MNADHILGLASAPTVKIVPTAGDYYILDTKAAGHIRHVIFHEPEIKSKGLTMVPTVEGNILVGPTDRPMAGEYETEKEGLDQISELVSEVIPSLPMDQIISYFGAVRPNPFIQLQNESGQWERQDRSVNDLCIVESDCGSMISLVGIKTPGLTCSNEIGEYVALKISSALEVGLNPSFNPKREAPLRVEELEPFELCELIRSRPEYGRIVCRCRGISEGEVVDAIRRSPGAVSLDGVKRRTGSDTGRCQGSFCSGRIIEILARELGVSVNEITKRGGESYLLLPIR
jgi:glycerol-3-phosphate dehydrogenase